MNYALAKSNENVNYPIHTNSSVAGWTPNTSDECSLAALIKNNVVFVRQDQQFLRKVDIQRPQDHSPASW
jgi:hypothetical protein